MSSVRRLAFSAMVAIQLAVPLALIGANELALARGRAVTLATIPVDPLDPFRGRYVELRYEISSGNVPDGWDTVYQVLVARGDRWVSAGMYPVRPDTDQPVIRGSVRDGRVEYGIETYYADEDEAPLLERRAGRLIVDVVLDADGRARIDGVHAR